MKKIASSLTVILLTALCYLLFLNINNVMLYKKNSELITQIKSKEASKKIYTEKEEELKQLKNENEEKIEEYEVVEKWNEEIENYLK